MQRATPSAPLFFPTGATAVGHHDGMQDATENTGEHEVDALAERFFSQPPEAWTVAHEDWQLRPMSSTERIAMLITAASAVTLLVVAIAWLVGAAPFVSCS